MAKDKLFYGSISNATMYANGANNFIRIRFDVLDSDTTLTNIVDVSGYFGLDKVIPGQELVASGNFPSGTTVVSVDVDGRTIEVSDAPDAAGSNRLARISPPKGQYFFNSGSLTRPTNNTTTTNDITGSEDTLFQNSDNKFGVLLLQASTSSLSSAISGDLAQYEISRVIDRQNTTTLSFYITGSSTGILSEEPDKAAASGITDFAIFELSYSSSLAPIFNQTVAGTPSGGYEIGAYQVALQEYFDDLRPGIYHSSSLVEGNADFINFTGSSVTSIITQSLNGQNGVLVKIEGGGDSEPFPYTGSAEITGSLGITGSFQVESGSTKPLTVNADGTVQLFAHENSYNPTPLLGGIYFTSQSVFFGLED